jgi:hypothetical protein
MQATCTMDYLKFRSHRRDTLRTLPAEPLRQPFVEGVFESSSIVAHCIFLMVPRQRQPSAGNRYEHVIPMLSIGSEVEREG